MDELEDLHVEEQISVFTTMLAEGDGWDPIKLKPQSNLLLTVPRQYFRCDTLLLNVLSCFPYTCFLLTIR